MDDNARVGRSKEKRFKQSAICEMTCIQFACAFRVPIPAAGLSIDSAIQPITMLHSDRAAKLYNRVDEKEACNDFKNGYGRRRGRIRSAISLSHIQPMPVRRVL